MGEGNINKGIRGEGERGREKRGEGERRFLDGMGYIKSLLSIKWAVMAHGGL